MAQVTLSHRKVHRKRDPKKIIELMFNNPKITRAEIAKSIGITVRGVQKNMNVLRNAGLVNRVGAAKGGHWESKISPNIK